MTCHGRTRLALARVSRDGLAANAQVIEVLTLHTQIDLDIAQRLARGQLSKRQSQELIETREVFEFVLRAPGLDHAAECLQRQISHDLRKDELTRVHARPQQIRSAKHAPSPENDSNHGQRENQIYSNKSLSYVWSVGKRWGTRNSISLKTRSYSESLPDHSEVSAFIGRTMTLG